MLKQGFKAAATELGTRTQFLANGEIEKGLSPTFGIAAAAHAPLVSNEAKLTQELSGLTY